MTTATVIVPAGVTPWQQHWTENRDNSRWSPAGVTPIKPETISSSDSKDLFLLNSTSDGAVYIPLTYPQPEGSHGVAVSASIDISALTQVLAGLDKANPTNSEFSLSFYCMGCDITSGATTTAAKPTPTVPEALTIGPGITIYVPYYSNSSELPSISPRVTEMQKAASLLVDAVSTGSTATTTSESGSSSASTTTSSDSGTNSDTNNDKEGKSDPPQFDGKVVAGGVIGAFLAGVVACALLLWLLRRHRRQKHAATRSTMRDERVSSYLPEGKEMQNLAIPMNVAGWQKHLPQEKDDGTIARTVKTVFEQVQVHVEGFYKKTPGNMNSEAVAAIERISSVDLAKKLSKAPNGVSLLEAILIRWIVRRISLRSVAAESFLPVEYTKIPEQNGWHMESDESGNGHSAEVKKGFPQAFSQWRALTAFLRTEPSAMRKSKPLPNVKIDQGVRDLTNAMAPWNIDGANAKHRDDNLRNILQLASDAALLIFAQPSTFMFDWSTRPGTVTISPSLVKRLDEFANPLPSPPVLIHARTL